MKTGIELIAEERIEQIEKHRCTIDYDISNNDQDQLALAAAILMEFKDNEYCLLIAKDVCPDGWSLKVWDHMWNKPYIERLIIAGALIAAEIDRLNSQEK